MEKYVISCVTKDISGNILKYRCKAEAGDATVYNLTAADLKFNIEKKGLQFVTKRNSVEADVKVKYYRQNDQTLWYLTTDPDNVSTNNLANLPTCPI